MPSISWKPVDLYPVACNKLYNAQQLHFLWKLSSCFPSLFSFAALCSRVWYYATLNFIILQRFALRIAFFSCLLCYILIVSYFIVHYRLLIFIAAFAEALLPCYTQLSNTYTPHNFQTCPFSELIGYSIISYLQLISLKGFTSIVF